MKCFVRTSQIVLIILMAGRASFAQVPPIAISPSSLDGAFITERVVADTIPNIQLPNSSDVIKITGDLLYNDLSWPSQVVFQFTNPSEDGSKFHALVIDSSDGAIVDSDAIFEIDSTFDVPITNGILLDEGENSDSVIRSASMSFVCGTLRRGTASIIVFGPTLTIGIFKGGVLDTGIGFVPLALTSSIQDAQMAAWVLADRFDNFSSELETVSLASSVSTGGVSDEQIECRNGCIDTRDRDIGRAKDKYDTDSFRCKRNHAIGLYVVCPLGLLVPGAGIPVYLVCALGDSVVGLVCEIDAEDDLATEIKNANSDFRSCLRGCGIVVYEN